MNDEFLDKIKVGFANAAAFGVSLADINQVLSMISLILAIGYTLKKWRDDNRRK